MKIQVTPTWQQIRETRLAE